MKWRPKEKDWDEAWFAVLVEHAMVRLLFGSAEFLRIPR